MGSLANIIYWILACAFPISQLINDSTALNNLCSLSTPVLSSALSSSKDYRLIPGSLVYAKPTLETNTNEARHLFSSHCKSNTFECKDTSFTWRKVTNVKATYFKIEWAVYLHKKVKELPLCLVNSRSFPPCSEDSSYPDREPVQSCQYSNLVTTSRKNPTSHLQGQFISSTTFRYLSSLKNFQAPRITVVPEAAVIAQCLGDNFSTIPPITLITC